MINFTPWPLYLWWKFPSTNWIRDSVSQLRRLVAGFQQRRQGFDRRSGHAGFVVDKVVLGHVFSEYFSFNCQFSLHRLLHTHRLSSGAGTVGQLVADVSSGLSLTPPQDTVTCTAVSMQRPRDKANEQRPFLGNSSVKTFPRKEICTHNGRTMFSMWSVLRNYNQDSWSNQSVEFCNGG
jgi:hypothetical protein